MNTPSHHRVHHGTNAAYIDRNYGGILIVWDRLFGSFCEEGERCVYGTRKPLDSWDPLWANAEVYWSLLRMSWRTRRWRDKLLVWFKPPGWRPADLPDCPGKAFALSHVQRYDPPVGRAVQTFGAFQFLLLLAGVSLFLWHADALSPAQAGVWLGALTAALWCNGAMLQGRLTITEVLLIEAAALSTACAASGLRDLHHLFKPLVMLLAMVLVASAGSGRAGERRSTGLLLLALACSLAGDVLLMWPGNFIPGLIAFLCAHLAYIALFKRRQTWFPSRRALLATLGLGAGMYGVLWAGGLPTGLRAPVAAYVVVIALMAAQAMGRALVQRDHAAWWVALGAGCFMLSDTLLAFNKFVMPLPLSALWILASYYAAQILIVRGMLAYTARP
jgi:uncharacterized membrane protein YhhN